MSNPIDQAKSQNFEEFYASRIEFKNYIVFGVSKEEFSNSFEQMKEEWGEEHALIWTAVYYPHVVHENDQYVAEIDFANRIFNTKEEACQAIYDNLRK